MESVINQLLICNYWVCYFVSLKLVDRCYTFIVVKFLFCFNGAQENITILFKNQNARESIFCVSAPSRFLPLPREVVNQN